MFELSSRVYHYPSSRTATIVVVSVARTGRSKAMNSPTAQRLVAARQHKSVVSAFNLE